MTAGCRPRAHWSSADARRQPISIYEVHAGSWQKGDNGEFLSWDELGDRLIPYCVDMGFTHIEFLPISEYPYDPSWGYQTTRPLCAHRPLREPEGFARFVDGAHKGRHRRDLDWVPAHFPVDAHALRHFDGTALYEHQDPRQGFHPDWNNGHLQFRPGRVFSYLVNNALLLGRDLPPGRAARRRGRLDALSRLFPQAWEWVPNEYGGNENLEACASCRP